MIFHRRRPPPPPRYFYHQLHHPTLDPICYLHDHYRPLTFEWFLQQRHFAHKLPILLHPQNQPPAFPLTFHSFQDLPYDIRIIIWKLTFHLLVSEFIQCDDDFPRTLRAHMPDPIALQINHESRSLAQKHYQYPSHIIDKSIDGNALLDHWGAITDYDSTYSPPPHPTTRQKFYKLNTKFAKTRRRIKEEQEMETVLFKKRILTREPGYCNLDHYVLFLNYSERVSLSRLGSDEFKLSFLHNLKNIAFTIPALLHLKGEDILKPHSLARIHRFKKMLDSYKCLETIYVMMSGWEESVERSCPKWDEKELWLLFMLIWKGGQQEKKGIVWKFVQSKWHLEAGIVEWSTCWPGEVRVVGKGVERLWKGYWPHWKFGERELRSMLMGGEKGDSFVKGWRRELERRAKERTKEMKEHGKRKNGLKRLISKGFLQRLGGKKVEIERPHSHDQDPKSLRKS